MVDDRDDTWDQWRFMPKCNSLLLCCCLKLLSRDSRTGFEEEDEYAADEEEEGELEGGANTMQEFCRFVVNRYLYS